MFMALNCSVIFVMYVVREFYGNHVKECGSIEKAERICSFSLDGNTFSI